MRLPLLVLLLAVALAASPVHGRARVASGAPPPPRLRLTAWLYDLRVQWLTPDPHPDPAPDPHPDPAPDPRPDPSTAFDFYVLALSWQAAFCQECPASGGCPGCSHPKAFWRSHFTLHGLWPEREDGTYPQNCEGDEFDAQELEAAIGMDTLETYWPNVKAPDDESRKYPTFWRHEWERHGTCSGLGMVEFFSQAIALVRNATISTPELIRSHVGKLVETPAVRAAYPPHAVLKCDNKDEPGDLAQVFICWEMDDKHSPTTPRACPASMRKEDTCVDSTVRILKFPEDPEDQYQSPHRHKHAAKTKTETKPRTKTKFGWYW